MKPFLKWAGGKRLLMPILKEYINRDKLCGHSYFEPFLGGGSLFFDLEHNSCVINDFNSEVINVYLQIRDNPNGLIKTLERFKNRHSSEFYYYVRNKDRSPNFKFTSKCYRAARTIYLNKTCYNGLYRVNSNGYFNTPIGEYINPMIYSERNIREISTFLNTNDIKIVNFSFEDAVGDAQQGDYIYFDPPYDYILSNGFVGYNKEGFNHDDLIKLKFVCDDLIRRGCYVLISNNDTPFVQFLFNDECYEMIYERKVISANRNINSNGSKRQKVSEVLIYGRPKQKSISTSK